MKKKLITALVGAGSLMTMPAFALSIDLDLFGGGLSVLDSLLLIGLGLALLGVLFLCIAFFKPEKEEAAEPEEFFHQLMQEETAEEEPDEVEEVEEAVEDIPEEEVPESIEELPEIPEDAEEEIPVEVEEPEEVPEEEAEEIVEEEAEQEEEMVEEKSYPTLTLTGINHEDFKILPLKEKVMLGRRPDNDLVFTDTTVSGSHCAITVEDGVVYLCDQGSTNGTYLNTKRIAEKTEIHKGDILALGQLEFRISI